MAAMLLKRCVELVPTEPVVNYELGFALMSMRCHAAAIPYFEAALANGDDFDRLLRLVELRKVPTLGEAAVRFGGTAEEHRQIFLVDPSNNVLEFKVYDDPRLLY